MRSRNMLMAFPMGTTSRSVNSSYSLPGAKMVVKMRSGLYNYTSAPELGKSLDHEPTRVWTPQELLAITISSRSRQPRTCAASTAHVRFGSKADIVGGLRYVRFTPKSGHRSALRQCPL